MFAKYLMKNDKDYRGLVKLVVKGNQEQYVAYTALSELTSDMVLLVDSEVKIIKDRTDGQWLDHRTQLVMMIDQVADEVRSSHIVSSSDTISLEYAQVESAITEWTDKGRDLEFVPNEVSYWAEVNDQDIKWATEDIMDRISKFNYVILEIRNIRLTAKRVLAVVDDSVVEAAFDLYAKQLRDLGVDPAARYQ